jgi:hypothetical protein
MKKLILLFSVIILASCSSDDDAGDVITNEFERISSVLPQGTWKVTTLIDGNEDHTEAFESFIFTFDEDGTVVSQTDLFSEIGIWAYKSTSQQGEQLILEFNDVTPFDQINDDWKIVSVTNSQVELSDVGDIPENTDLLVFTKI